jgi:hypothetical protein
MLEACYLFHRMSFDAPGMLCLYGRVWVNNDRAWRLHQFLGCVEEGVRRQHECTPDGYVDVYSLSCFSHKFDGQRQAIEIRLCGSKPPPGMTEPEGKRLRRIVGKVIHRDLEAAWVERTSCV